MNDLDAIRQARTVKREILIDDITPDEAAGIFAHFDAEQQAAFLHRVGLISDNWPGAGWCQQCCSISQHLTPKAKETVAKLAEWAADPYMPEKN